MIISYCTIHTASLVHMRPLSTAKESHGKYVEEIYSANPHLLFSRTIGHQNPQSSPFAYCCILLWWQMRMGLYKATTGLHFKNIFRVKHTVAEHWSRSSRINVASFQDFKLEKYSQYKRRHRCKFWHWMNSVRWTRSTGNWCLLVKHTTTYISVQAVRPGSIPY